MNMWLLVLRAAIATALLPAPAAADAAAAAVTLRSGGMAVSLQPSGAFSLSLDSQPWLAGGDTAIAVRATTEGDGPTLLRPLAPPSAVRRGTDTWGDYESVEMRWGGRSGGAAQLLTSVRAYTDAAREMMVFSQAWPEG